ncbi:uncharacterized protein NPIL_290251 [Nephila pilipes]|uniref:Cyclin-dependent kinase inhibitor domain-containing protein n=1 Tax=Nephila pilipes TaxID=299642 RepID=A0A8X6PLV0_NEPPI|nr:uncharacterized protein NPIL_290251 [Nephila pilipes]
MGILRPDPGPGVLWAPMRARRCLFGPPDHEFTDNFLETETKKLEKKNRDRWNFDFVQGTPLEGGRYAWTPVTDDNDAEVKKDDASSENHRNDDDSTKTTESKQTQKLITDFMRKRKLSSDDSRHESPFISIFAHQKSFIRKTSRAFYKMDVTQLREFKGKYGKTPIIYLYLVMVFFISLYLVYKQLCYCSIFLVPGSFVRLYVGDQRRYI